MAIHFNRHATFVLKTGAVREMVDPMLGRAGVAPAVPNTPNAKPKTPSSSCRSGTTSCLPLSEARTWSS
ncbi:MAG: hypothetical protein AVDCRST_MAG55-2955 [uncultured Rubrobacteraceae bacterium]|uniref:Uncharacterized protein n=1 Tax=uncultured Rubrobacteraceae bacterium TaxID=349277 RepID=A0A6J4Q6Q6_9ACTN|nr:MAG: hypothetical protein AVDCRST_MAG55-2955 [uncultured Rubrobacteraceae bacterium]